MRALWVIAVVIGLVGCTTPSGSDLSAMPGCNETGDFAFVGKATLASLGLGDIADRQTSFRVGTVWVTAGPVPWGNGRERIVCAHFPDDSSLSAVIQGDWQPPPGTQSASPAADGSSPLPGLMLAVGLVVAVSLASFRKVASG